MNKCVKFSIEGEIPREFWEKKLLKLARAYKLEGTAQKMAPTTIKIMACGPASEIDSFIDDIYNELAEHDITYNDMVPFLKDRDFRGVFRLIE